MTKRFLVAGASGLIGTSLLRQGPAQSGASFTALVRRPLSAPIDGVDELVVDYEKLDELTLDRFDAVFCCLGTTIKVAGSKAAFRRVDLDYVAGVARAAKRSKSPAFLMVSAAAPSLDSRFFYSRVKAEAENAVKAMAFESLVIARPSLLLGDRDALHQPGRPGESWAQRIGRLVKGITPLAYRPIEDHRLARVLLAYALAAPAGVTILESRDLHAR
jgi:uncharacterized protein YbjT (DUF2867 family)